MALPGFRVSQHTHVHSPSPRSISQSIKCLLPVSLFTAGQQQTVCILTVRVYSRGNHTQPSHSPSFGEAFPTAISPRRPALSLLRALQQCVPPRLQPTSRCGPGPAIFLAFPPLARPAWCWCCCYYCYCAVISCMSDCTRDKCPNVVPGLIGCNRGMLLEVATNCCCYPCLLACSLAWSDNLTICRMCT